eukprot:4771962-Prymnesium_polylepis.2
MPLSVSVSASRRTQSGREQLCERIRGWGAATNAASLRLGARTCVATGFANRIKRLPIKRHPPPKHTQTPTCTCTLPVDPPNALDIPASSSPLPNGVHASTRGRTQRRDGHRAHVHREGE